MTPLQNSGLDSGLNLGAWYQTQTASKSRHWIGKIAVMLFLCLSELFKVKDMC